MYIITHDITILQEISLCLASFFLPASTDQDAHSSNGCRDWKCFHPWLPLFVDTRGTLDGQAIVACLSRLLQIQKCFQTGVIVFHLATSSISASVSSLPALAGSIDTDLSLIDMLTASHVQ